MTIELWAPLVLAIGAVLCAGYCCLNVAARSATGKAATHDRED